VADVLGGCDGHGLPMTITPINPDSLAPLPGGSHAVVAEGRSIHVSGQTGVDAEGKVVGADHRSQTVQALRNLLAVLDAAGASPADLVHLRMYLVGYDDRVFAAFLDGVFEVFGEDLPAAATTLLGVECLWQPDILVEIDAVAVV
jgi:enamine deaminase RidA (YjgF/YER057c/UK114 family)